MLLPLLSAKDPVASTEGTLDPLGLYQIADALGVKLIPGVRERMSHPRFLTLASVTAAVCADFDEDTLSSDGVSSPQQVFEWHVVEGLVRCIDDDKRLSGLPGQDKVRRAIGDGISISARSYLKTPSVFGFLGVYRLLSKTLDIESDGRLGEAGYRLLDVWRSEQDLPGFFESRVGRGSDILRLWRDAVKDGLAKGRVDRSVSWQGWQRMADHLGPYDAGPKERRLLAELIASIPVGFTHDVMNFLRETKGREIFKAIRDRNKQDNVWSERPFYSALRPATAGPLQNLLDAISAYEVFARLLQDAFDECLFVMSQNKSRTTAAELAGEKLIKKAAREVPPAFEHALDALAPVDQSNRLLQSFQSVAEKMPPQEWVQRLLDHHRKVQQAKPPNGKLPWLERFDDGGYLVRPGYTREKSGLGDDSFVHAYRLGSLWSFASDLKLV